MTIRKILLGTIVGIAMGMPAHADEDFGDKILWWCNSDKIQSALSGMIERSFAGKFGTHLLYVKDVKETVRTKDELRCHITAVFSTVTLKGFFSFLNQDGHSLVQWKGV